MTILYIFLGLAFTFVCLVVLIGFLLSGPKYKGPKTKHFDGKRFHNPSGRPANGFKEASKYLSSGTAMRGKWVKNYETSVRTEALPEKNQEGEILVSFVNHSTFLIQMGSKNILTDPVWSEKCSPFQFAGPGRMRPPGIEFDALPSIDLVLLSHNHYDHLDKPTVKRLVKEHNPTFIVPLGVDGLLHRWGVKQTKTIALDWDKSVDIDSIKFTATSANHFSSRGLFDRDATLWCGFIIHHQGLKCYYVGDTGYGDNFKEIGQKYGPMDLSLIPIGAYKPEWFMGPIHVTPVEAIQIHKDVKSKKSLAMHFGTFPLASDDQEEPTDWLVKARVEANISEEEFLIPEEGVSYRN